jgi:ketosteroid isomerase-like protein
MRAMMLAVLAVLAACTANPGASSGTDLQVIRNAIDSLDQQVQRWVAQEKTDSIVNGYYTTDAIVMNPNGPAAVGIEAIRASFNGFFKQSAVRIRFKMASIVVSDSVASEQGHYTLEIRAKPDTTKVLMSDHGNYVTTFVKRNGQWRALFDIATSEVPVAPPPAAPAGKKK